MYYRIRCTALKDEVGIEEPQGQQGFFTDVTHMTTELSFNLMELLNKIQREKFNYFEITSR